MRLSSPLANKATGEDLDRQLNSVNHLHGVSDGTATNYTCCKVLHWCVCVCVRVCLCVFKIFIEYVDPSLTGNRYLWRRFRRQDLSRRENLFRHRDRRGCSFE